MAEIAENPAQLARRVDAQPLVEYDVETILAHLLKGDFVERRPAQYIVLERVVAGFPDDGLAGQEIVLPQFGPLPELRGLGLPAPAFARQKQLGRGHGARVPQQQDLASLRQHLIRPTEKEIRKDALDQNAFEGGGGCESPAPIALETFVEDAPHEGFQARSAAAGANVGKGSERRHARLVEGMEGLEEEA